MSLECFSVDVMGSLFLRWWVRWTHAPLPFESLVVIYWRLLEEGFTALDKKSDSAQDQLPKRNLERVVFPAVTAIDITQLQHL
ncbi:hypothetical protein TNCV_3971751 [Trichonephila clavipes]|nr:hypothetical protein TNCV_3971751 [Trichonephila clavipes]